MTRLAAVVLALVLGFAVAFLVPALALLGCFALIITPTDDP